MGELFPMHWEEEKRVPVSEEMKGLWEVGVKEKETTRGGGGGGKEILGLTRQYLEYKAIPDI